MNGPEKKKHNEISDSVKSVRSNSILIFRKIWKTQKKNLKSFRETGDACRNHCWVKYV